ncbi:MAG: hypothetical protein ACYTBZ_30190, partial [Planctomycetota bacterium]
WQLQDNVAGYVGIPSSVLNVNVDKDGVTVRDSRNDALVVAAPTVEAATAALLKERTQNGERLPPTGDWSETPYDAPPIYG